MQRKIYTSFEAAARRIERAGDLGAGLQLFGTVPRYAQLPLTHAVRMLSIPMQLRQYHVRTDASGRPGALLTWAWVSQQTLQSPARAPAQWHRCEWNEGESLCICDLVSADGCSHTIMADFVADLARGEQQIYSAPRPGGAAQFRCWQPGELPELLAWLGAEHA